MKSSSTTDKVTDKNIKKKHETHFKYENISDEYICQCIQDNMYEIFRFNGRSPLYDIQESSELLRACHGAKELTYQGVGYANLTDDNVDEKIETVISYFKERNLPFMWVIGRDTKPTNLGEILQKHGLIDGGAAPAMAVNLEKLEKPTLPKGFTIKLVENQSQLRTFTDVFTESHPFPKSLGEIYYNIFTGKGFNLDYPNKFYIGYFNDKPVATSRVFLGKEFAGLYWVATHPSVRGKGIGTAMTVTPLQEAHALGYNVGSLFSSKLGLHVYQKVGFKEYYKLGIYVWRPPNN